MLEGLVFLSPWMLVSLIVLPILWWVLRSMPPRTREIKFPAFFLLKNIEAKSSASSHTPFWLLLLRTLMIAMFILAFADPVINPVSNIPMNIKGNILLVVDNNWAAANKWQSRTTKIKEYITRAGRSDIGVVIIPTAKSDLDGKVKSYGVMTANDAKGFLNKLKPVPWQASYRSVTKVLDDVLREKNIAHSVYFSSGIKVPNGFIDEFDIIVEDKKTNNPYMLKKTGRKLDDFTFVIERIYSSNDNLELHGYSSDGALVDKLKIDFPSGDKEYEFNWGLLPEIKAKIARIVLYSHNTAATTILLDQKSDRYNAGIISNHNYVERRDLLDEVYYLNKALEDGGSVSIADIEKQLANKNVSALILPDSTALNMEEQDRLFDWVINGGVLIRFAGSNLAADIEDNLLPVELRYGQRAMSGTMTWGKPLHIANISDTSPFYGIAVPENVVIQQQVLANPSPEVFEKTWLRLEDGTPLVTGTKLAKGTIILVHTTAGPDWSDLCYSELYVEMLERMASLGHGVIDYKTSDILSPMMLMNGFGALQSIDRKLNVIKSIKPDDSFYPSPETPPGVYGDRYNFKIFNLGNNLPKMKKVETSVSSTLKESYIAYSEVSLKYLLLKLALVLLFIDTVVALWLRRAVAFIGCIVAMCICLQPSNSLAAENNTANYINSVNLAYIITGDKDIDDLSHNGLAGLAKTVSTRTSIKVKGIVGVNPENSYLLYYPFVYWPMSAKQPNLSILAARNLQNYMARGGVVLIDTRDMQFGSSDEEGILPGAKQMRNLTRNIQISELIKNPKNHLLSRSYYLMDKFPGKYVGGNIWVEKEPDVHHDGVTSIIIGSNDWAASWSKDPQDQAHHMVLPGGELQREKAYRFGINLVMMSLTGSYKADQIHVSNILERIGK